MRLICAEPLLLDPQGLSDSRWAVRAISGGEEPVLLAAQVQIQSCQPDHLSHPRIVTVELNRAFVPLHLQSRLEEHLHQAWANTRIAHPTLKVKWVHEDPGNLVVAVELGNARVSLTAPAGGPEALAIVAEMQETLHGFLLANRCRG